MPDSRHVPTFKELSISPEGTVPLALAMTGASFESAGQADCVRIEADLGAMEHIAQRIGFIASGEKLQPLVIVSHEMSPSRSTIPHWDDLLPLHQKMPTTGRYYPANRLNESQPPTINRNQLVSLAKAIGAPCLTELTIDWTRPEIHAEQFASSLMTGQRPLDLPQPNLARQLWWELRHGADGDKARALLRREQHVLQPFRITYRPTPHAASNWY